MEFLLELIFDIVGEGLLEGALDGMESKKVAMPLRILLAVFLCALLIGVTILFIILAKESDSALAWGIFMTILAALYIGLAWKIWKVFHKRNQ